MRVKITLNLRKNTKIIHQSPVSQQTVQEEQITVNAAFIDVPTKM